VETDMLAHRLADRGPAVAADVARLPFRSEVFDVTAAAFVLNHVPDHVAALGELARVTRRGGRVLASVFGNERSAAKDAVDQTLVRFGWTEPDWYAAVRERAEAIGTTSLFRDRARDAGLERAEVTCTAVDLDLDSPDLVVRYRLGLAHAHEFVSEMDPETLAALVNEATTAVARTGEPFRPEVLELVAPVS
jgi:SAM-dependent methyltransferase